MTLGALAQEAVARSADRPFFIPLPGPGGGPTPSPERYSEFFGRVQALAGGLLGLGLGPGDRLGVVLANCPELVDLWFAAGLTGVVIVPLNPSLTADERSRLLDYAEVAFVVDGTDRGRDASARRPDSVMVTPARGRAPTPFNELYAATSLGRAPVTMAGDPLAILFTSGTTGDPRACVLTHQSIVAPAREFLSWMQVVPSDRFFACLPLFHLAGIAFATAAVAAGAALCVVDRFSGSRFWDQVAESGATIGRYLGEMLAVLCQQPLDCPAPRHRLRALYGGGATRRVAEEFERRFGVRVVEGYGLTETNTVLRNELGRSTPGSIGRTLPYCDVRIANGLGEEQPCGQVGEIQARRNAVMMTGYFRSPAATASAFQGDWYRTGDLGLRDEDGNFYLVGREKDVIRRRGENIAAREIEEVIDAHPAVRGSAVIAVADELGGEEGKAFIVVFPGAALAIGELRAWCSASLAGFKLPKYVELCPELPRTSTNKVDKRILRQRSTLGGECFELTASVTA